jgi:carnosine N-methyltransferase
MRHPRYRELAQSLFTQSDYIARAQNCIDTNALLLSQVAEVAAASFGVSAPEQRAAWAACDAASAEKVVSTLRQAVREWSAEGAAEREVCYGRVIAEICRLFPDYDDPAAGGPQRAPRPRNTVRVVVPGCGLGRLPLELAVRGFAAQGNEFSFHMLFMSNYMLNCTLRPHEFAVYPYVHSQSHQRSRDLQLRAVRVPDVHPGQLMAYRDQYHPDSPSGELSMVLGSFDDIYLKQNATANNNDTNNINNNDNEQGQFETAEVVATVFFIDTAPNIFRTLDAIAGLLQPGGYWINFGPLLWHYEDVQQGEDDDAETNDNDDDRTRGLELTLEELLELIPKYGFVLEKHESGIPCSYTMDDAGMGGFVYKCEYWVARKL